MDRMSMMDTMDLTDNMGPLRSPSVFAPPDLPSARMWLQRAIDRHERHLSGEEPTDEDSQHEMMTEMEEALIALGPAEDDAPPLGGPPMMGGR